MFFLLLCVFVPAMLLCGGIFFDVVVPVLKAILRGGTGILDPLAQIDITASDASGRGYRREDSPWTPAEREALGINDTDRLIERIQGELNGMTWDSTKAGRYADGGIVLPRTPRGPGGGSPPAPHVLVIHATDPAIPPSKVWTRAAGDTYNRSPTTESKE